MAYDKKSFLMGLAAGLATRGVPGTGRESPQREPYLTFSSLNPFTLATVNAEKNWDGTIEWSTDANTWAAWDGTAILTAAGSGTHFLYLHGIGNTTINGATVATDMQQRGWTLTGNAVSCSGDIRTLLDYSDVDSASMSDFCFASLFYNCTSLIHAPRLPSTSLSPSCYRGMFQGCTGLISAPELPASTMEQNCYQGMFMDCTSLEIAPELSAQSLARMCYAAMFRNCTGLIAPPALPASQLAERCYNSMFMGCANLEYLPTLSAITLTPYCYAAMFQECRKIKLSATQAGEYQTAYRIPSSGTGTTANFAMSQMLRDTGGTFTSAPSINTTYYTSNQVI